MKGVVRSFGTKAISLETEDKRQYYAPFCDVHKEVMGCLVPKLEVPVIFEVDITRFAGETVFGKRYYAKNVTLQNVDIEIVL